MKRSLLFLLVFSFIFLPSCNEEMDPLAYQQTAFEYRARLTLADSSSEYLVTVTRDGEGVMRLGFDAPEELSLISFVKDGSGVVAYCSDRAWEGMSFPYAEAVFDLFSIESSDFLSAEKDKLGEVPICISHFGNGLTVTLDARDNSPLVIESEQIRLCILR